MSIRTKKRISVLFCLLLTIVSYAQIQQATSHYMFNPSINNPAFYGSQDGFNFGANYRHQWAKLDGQPATVNVFADAKFLQIHGGVGFTITNDRLGAFNNTSFKAGYTFIQDIKQKIKIAIGINAGATFSKLDGSKIITPEGTNGNLNDDYLSNVLQKSTRPDMTVGVAIFHKYIEAGINYTNIINLPDKFKGTTKTLKPKYGSVFQTYISSNVKIGTDFSIRPSLLLTTDFKELQTDISILAGYKNYLSVGLNARGYNKRAFESLSPIISVGPIKNICIVYSYDVSLNKLNLVNKGSHEITLKYFLPNSKIYNNPKVINNPRFL
ncbi:MAG: PorP/SprF family type IX secretion system membrane protein [Chitinophagales bacterium]|nr:PorP/SprF family type IX secretion system membrane protein [Chitinophagales bacterium]